MVIQDGIAARDTSSLSSSKDFQTISACLEVIFSNNVFQFVLDKVLRTAAYQVSIFKWLLDSVTFSCFWFEIGITLCLECILYDAFVSCKMRTTFQHACKFLNMLMQESELSLLLLTE